MDPGLPSMCGSRMRLLSQCELAPFSVLSTGDRGRGLWLQELWFEVLAPHF